MSSELLRYLEFSINNERFALPLLEVKEVIPVPETTAIPKSPEYFIGIMNLRGQVITILDLKKKIGLKDIEEENREQSTIILNIEDFNLGIVVDSINRVISPTIDQIKDIQTEDQMKKKNGIKNIIQIDNDMIMLIDARELLEIDKFNQVKKSA